MFSKKYYIYLIWNKINERIALYNVFLAYIDFYCINIIIMIWNFGHLIIFEILTKSSIKIL
jgi:hypothetical protein